VFIPYKIGTQKDQAFFTNYFKNSQFKIIGNMLQFVEKKIDIINKSAVVDYKYDFCGIGKTIGIYAKNNVSLNKNVREVKLENVRWADETGSLLLANIKNCKKTGYYSNAFKVGDKPTFSKIEGDTIRIAPCGIPDRTSPLITSVYSVGNNNNIKSVDDVMMTSTGEEVVPVGVRQTFKAKDTRKSVKSVKIKASTNNIAKVEL
jgi:hypothetical protein